ncbi:MAG: UvrD-helicase domain-containing protein, partial [Acidobacteriota bacterium]|nr:UvrD-helicase domain-containing protein [Acidobacteriota bacterium]
LEAARAPTLLDAPLSKFDIASRGFAIDALKRDAALNWGLLDRPQRLNIRTIDSVCAEIAITLPLLSGSGAPRTPSPDSEPLYRLAAQRALMQLGGPDAALSAAIRNVLLHRDGSLADCETLLARMLAAREQWGDLVPLGARLDDEALEKEVRPKLERALEQIVCAGLTRAAKAMPPDMLIALSWLAARLSHQPGYKGATSPIFICAGKHDPPEAHVAHLEHWNALIHLLLKPSDGDWRIGLARNHLGFEIDKSDVALLKQLIEEVREDGTLREALCAVRCLPPAHYPDEQWVVAKALFRLLVRALAELKVLFAERQQCDFTELAMAAREALRAENGATDFASAAGSTLRHLLVDEMQDTSSSQYELIAMLSRSWDGHSQTLFLVGDPKQSIYLFRQARVERFLRAMREERLGEIKLGALHLTANFRSQATLVKNFNRDFGRIFPLPGDEGSAGSQALDVPFVHADFVRDVSPVAAGLVWNTSILGGAGDDGSTLANAKHERRMHALEEARYVRSVVEIWRARPLPEGRAQPWRIAVLARARTHFAHIIAEFDRPGPSGDTVPFRALEIEQLGERPEVLDTLALTCALLHPADRVAWLAVLHAPWCGLGIADLLALSGGGIPEAAAEALPAVVAARRDLLSPDGRKHFDRAWPILEDALAQRGRTSTATWVERTWRSLGGDVSLTAQQLANVGLFLTALREVEEPGGRVDLALLAGSVRRLYAEPRSGSDAVDLTTIHNAKGLEWDVVLVPALERRGQTSRSEFLNWLELDSSDDEMAHVILAPIWGKGGQPDALHKWLTGVRSAREAAEHKRLYYVACTRAREELHLFGAATRKKDGQLYAKPGTLLQAAWPAALPNFERDTGSGTAISTTAEMFGRAFADRFRDSAQTFAIAAGAVPETRLLLQRLPLSFDPHQRFAAATAQRLPYTPAAALRQGPTFDRPEGSFAVRAFGNVVHRYLQVLTARLEQDFDADTLLAELPAWVTRLTASLRSEGLAPATLDRLAQRSLLALQQALHDETGRWILSPHAASHSEQALHLGTEESGEMRIDRTFLAGPDPLSEGSSHLWIVDFKTTEQGSRSPELFAEQEKAKYGAQLATYAKAKRAVPGAPSNVVLGLYYPLVPHLIYWTAP